MAGRLLCYNTAGAHSHMFPTRCELKQEVRHIFGKRYCPLHCKVDLQGILRVQGALPVQSACSSNTFLQSSALDSAVPQNATSTAPPSGVKATYPDFIAKWSVQPRLNHPSKPQAKALPH
jgi:hypothetical protein